MARTVNECIDVPYLEGDAYVLYPEPEWVKKGECVPAYYVMCAGRLKFIDVCGVSQPAVFSSIGLVEEYIDNITMRPVGEALEGVNGDDLLFDKSDFLVIPTQDKVNIMFIKQFFVG